MVSAMRALPPAFFWWLSMTGDAMLRSPSAAKVRITPSRCRTGSRTPSRSGGGRRDSARSRGPRARPTRSACRPSVVVPGVAEGQRAGRGARRPPVGVGEGAPQRGLDGAVEAVVGDKVAVAVLARLLEPAERAEELVVAAPERDVVADAGGLVGDLALDLGEELLGGGVEVAGEHEVLPDEEAEGVAGLVEGGRLVAAAAPDADHVHVGVRRGLQQGAGLRA